MDSWTNLTVDLLKEIASRLDRFEVMRLRSVCPSWRASVPIPPKAPLNPDGSALKIPFPIDSSNGDPTVQGYFLLEESKILYLESPNFSSSTGFAVLKMDYRDCGKVCFEELLHGSAFIPPSKGNPLNLLEFRVKQIGVIHTLKFVSVESESSNIRKVCLGYQTVVDFWVGTVEHRKLAIWKSGEAAWNIVFDRDNIKDVVFCKQMFYALDTHGHLFEVEPSSVSVTRVVSAGQGWVEGRYLFVCAANIFLLSYIPDAEMDGLEKHAGTPFTVNLYKFEGNTWVKPNNLDGGVAFLNPSYYFAVSNNSHCNGMEPNTLFFGGWWLYYLGGDGPKESYVGYGKIFCRSNRPIENLNESK